MPQKGGKLLFTAATGRRKERLPFSKTRIKGSGEQNDPWWGAKRGAGKENGSFAEHSGGRKKRLTDSWKI